MALLLPSAALAQGITPYETYQTPSGIPDYQANLTPLPDDAELLGALPGRARDYGEIADIDADYDQWRISRQREIQGQAGNLDTQRLMTDSQRRRFSDNGPNPLPGSSALPPTVSIQPYPPLYGQRNDLITAPTAPNLLISDRIHADGRSRPTAIRSRPLNAYPGGTGPQPAGTSPNLPS